MRARRLGSLGFALALGFAVACLDFSGARDRFCALNPSVCGDGGTPDAGSTDAGPRDAGLADAGPPDAGCKGVAPSPVADSGYPRVDGGGNATTAFYVAASMGLDSNPGTMSSPFATLTHAVTAAGNGPADIYVCAGTYSGVVTITKPISVRGGYRCTGGTWSRPADYGFISFDAGFNPSVQTLLQPASSECAPTLTLSGAPLTASTVIDGLAISASAAACPTTMSTTPWAVVVDLGSSPTIQNCNIHGASSGNANGAIGSGGIAINNGSFPDVSFNWIYGGGGYSATREGSVAVAMDGTPALPHIHDNYIYGGSGSSSQSVGAIAGTPGIGSLGVGNYTAQGLVVPRNAALERNWISGGTGVNTLTTGNAGEPGSVGIYMHWGNSNPMDVVGNYIEGGSGGTGNASAFGTIAVRSLLHGTLQFYGNAVYGGEPSSGSSVGIILSSGNNTNQVPAFVVNNMIHAGSRNGHVGSVGVASYDVAGPVVAQNTLWVVSGGTGLSFRSTGSTTGTSTSIQVLGNLFLGNGAGTGLDMQTSCLGFSAFHNNAFIGTFGALGSLSGCSQGTVSTPSALDQGLGTVAMNTLITSNSCGGEAGCIARAGCTTPDACIADVVQGAGTDNGYSSLVTRAGWPLAAQPPCAIMASAATSSFSSVDYYWLPRMSSSPSIGAAEEYCGCD